MAVGWWQTGFWGERESGLDLFETNRPHTWFGLSFAIGLGSEPSQGKMDLDKQKINFKIIKGNKNKR